MSQSSPPIRTAAVLGAGVMGAGIAAHLANAGIPTLLLDIVPPNLSDAEKADRAARNRFAQGGLDKALKARPAAFFHASRARLVRVGNLEDDLDKLRGCDIVIEAVLERLDVKQALFERLEKVIGPETIVTSNTSGLPIAQMMKGRSEAFRKHFLVTHFFNPPRYMKLLEIIVGPETDPAVLMRVSRFCRDSLGKGIVLGKDTPNFVANRIGAYAMMKAIHQMLADKLTPEDVDLIVGEPMGRPKSAAFRTADMVGLDTFVNVADNCYAALEADEEREVFKVPPYIRAMLEKKQLGDKTKGGFYKKGAAGIDTLDPETGEYRPKKQTPAIAAATKALKGTEDAKDRLRKIMADTGPAGTFAWKVMAAALAYTARRVPEISDDIGAIDDAMRWGYNWDLGPFEAWDALGFEQTLSRMDQDGIAVPDWIRQMKAGGARSFYQGGTVIVKGHTRTELVPAVWSPAKKDHLPRVGDHKAQTLSGARRGMAPVVTNGGGALWDIGDGVCALTYATKANSVDADVIQLYGQAIERAEKDFKALIIFNEGEHFSVGANLFAVVMAANQKQWAELRQMVRALQAANQRMKYASIPIVAAPYGMTLGGGLESCLGATAVQAHAETYAGLVEVGVGIIPGGAGTLNLLWRAFEGVPDGAKVDSYALVTQVFMNIGLARVATSAAEAQEYGYFRKSDGISFDKARLLHDAKQRALGLAVAGHHLAIPRAYTLPGDSGIATIKMMLGSMATAGQASEHDVKIGSKLAEVLCGGVDGAAGPVSEERMLELECEGFLSLCGEPKSLERMQHMLMQNKPLRN